MTTVSFVWEDLGQIPWATLEHNYGSAENVPALLRACADPDVVQASDAFDELDNLLYHQGGWVCSAAAAALPFLLDLGEGRATAYRHAFVDLVFRLAQEATRVDSRSVFRQPGIHEVLIPLREYASVLKGPVTAQLGATTNVSLVSCLCDVLAAWQSDMDSAISVLVRLLANDDCWAAATRALGSIGPAAAAAAGPLRCRSEGDNLDSIAAWAWFRVSADQHAADLVLRMLHGQPRPATMRHIADLGARAAAAIPRLEDLAHWRVSGNPRLAVSTLAAVVRPLTSATRRPRCCTAPGRARRSRTPREQSR